MAAETLQREYIHTPQEQLWQCRAIICELWPKCYLNPALHPGKILHNGNVLALHINITSYIRYIMTQVSRVRIIITAYHATHCSQGAKMWFCLAMLADPEQYFDVVGFIRLLLLADSIQPHDNFKGIVVKLSFYNVIKKVSDYYIKSKKGYEGLSRNTIIKINVCFGFSAQLQHCTLVFFALVHVVFVPNLNVLPSIGTNLCWLTTVIMTFTPTQYRKCLRFYLTFICIGKYCILLI